jgi:hypothetical protein
MLVAWTGHPSSVDALLAFDEDTLLTGCQDGLIRIIGVLPNKMLGVVGEHGDYPVERLALSGAAACSHAHPAALPCFLDRPSFASSCLLHAHPCGNSR